MRTKRILLAWCRRALTLLACAAVLLMSFAGMSPAQAEDNQTRSTVQRAESEADIPRSATNPYINITSLCFENAHIVINDDRFTQGVTTPSTTYQSLDILYQGEPGIFGAEPAYQTALVEWEETYSLEQARQDLYASCIEAGQSEAAATAYANQNAEWWRNWYIQTQASLLAWDTINPTGGNDSLVDVWFENAGVLSDTGQTVHVKLSLKSYRLRSYYEDGLPFYIAKQNDGSFAYTVPTQYTRCSYKQYYNASHDLKVPVLYIFHAFDSDLTKPENARVAMESIWSCEQEWEVSFYTVEGGTGKLADVSRGDAELVQVKNSPMSGSEYRSRQYFYDLDVQGIDFVNEDGSIDYNHNGHNYKTCYGAESVTLNKGYIGGGYVSENSNLANELYYDQWWVRQKGHNNEAWSSRVGNPNAANHDIDWDNAFAIDTTSSFSFSWSGTDCGTALTLATQYYDNGTLKLTKETSDQNTTSDFTFDIRLEQITRWVDGVPHYASTQNSYAYEIWQPSSSGYVLKSSGQTTARSSTQIVLRHGEQLYIKNIPEGTRCYVQEVGGNQHYAVYTNDVHTNTAMVTILKDDLGTSAGPSTASDIPQSNVINVFNSKTVSISLAKTSTQPFMTNNNACYSLKGAIYDVYADDELTDLVGSFETAASGTTNQLELPAGVYYVKERTASPGFMLDEEVHTVNATTPGNYYRVNSLEEPLVDPLGLVVTKLDAQSGSSAQGSASLANANFSVAYYDNTTGNTSGSPKYTWVLKSDVSGKVVLRPEYKISGDDVFLVGEGQYALPIGTYTIQETQAPEGYRLSDASVHVAVFDGTSWTSQGGWNNERSVADEVVRGGLDLIKVAVAGLNADADDLSGAAFSIINANSQPVVVDGESYEPDAVVMTIETARAADSKAHASVGEDKLPYGSYIIQEVTPPRFFTLPQEARSVVITQDHTVVELGEWENTTTATANVVFEVHKELTGRELEANQFSFELRDSQGKLLQTAQNTATGDVRFAPLEFDVSSAGYSYTYTISEVDAGEGGYLYDTHVLEARVCITGNFTPEGSLEAEVSYTGSTTFTNVYEKYVLPATGLSGGAISSYVGIVFVAGTAILIGRLRKRRPVRST